MKNVLNGCVLDFIGLALSSICLPVEGMFTRISAQFIFLSHPLHSLCPKFPIAQAFLYLFIYLTLFVSHKHKMLLLLLIIISTNNKDQINLSCTNIPHSWTKCKNSITDCLCPCICPRISKRVSKFSFSPCQGADLNIYPNFCLRTHPGMCEDPLCIFFHMWSLHHSLTLFPHKIN